MARVRSVRTAVFTARGSGSLDEGAPPIPSDEDTCRGCRGTLRDSGVSAMGGFWHDECFVCGLCSEMIDSTFVAGDNGLPYHKHCLEAYEAADPTLQGPASASLDSPPSSAGTP
eukprot:322677_1